MFYKHSLFRARFRSPLPSARAFAFSLSLPVHPRCTLFQSSLSSLFLESPRLTFPFLSVQRNDPEYLSIYASQFMNAHGLYSNHLLPTFPPAPFPAAYLLLRFILCFWHTKKSLLLSNFIRNSFEILMHSGLLQPHFYPCIELINL